MFLSLLLACATPTEKVPPSLDELSRAALKNFEADDEADHVDALVTWLQTNPIPEKKGWAFDSIDEDTVGDLERDMEVCADLSITGGAGVVDTVDGSLDLYAAASMEADQSFADKTYAVWDRTIISGESTFLGGGDMVTDNHVEKSGPFGIVIPYDLDKDFRWVPIEGGDAMIARSVVPHSGFDQSGSNGILCGYTIEIWANTEGGVFWYNGSWSRLKTMVDDIASEELMEDQLIKGTLDYFEGTEAHVMGLDDTAP